MSRASRRPGTAVRRWYVTSATADTGATELFDVALAWTAATTGGTQASIVLAAAVAPRFILFLVGGAVADRLGLARVAQWTLAARVLLMGAYTVLLLTGQTSILWLALAAAAFAAADAFHDPAIRPMTTRLVANDGELGALNASVTAARRVMVMAATLAAGVLASHGAAAGAAAMALVVVALLAMRIVVVQAPTVKDASHPGEGSVLEDVKAGVKYAGSTPQVLWPLILFAVANLVSTPGALLGIPLQGTANDWAGWSYGIVYALYAGGGLLGAVVFNRLAPRIELTLRNAGITLIPQAVGLVLLAVMGKWVVVAGAAAFMIGLSGTVTGILLITALQSVTPDEYQGRVMSLVGFSISALIPVGHLAYGAAANGSLEWTGVACGVLLAVVAVLALLRPVAVSPRPVE